jgi:hypothetical protein
MLNVECPAFNIQYSTFIINPLHKESQLALWQSWLDPYGWQARLARAVGWLLTALTTANGIEALGGPAGTAADTSSLHDVRLCLLLMLASIP